MEKYSFPLKTLDGLSYDPLQSIDGKGVLILLYHTSCLGCTGRALPLAWELSKEFPDVLLVVVHVEFNTIKFSKDQIREVFTDSKPPFPVYLDELSYNYKHFQAEGTPYWLVFDRRGKLKHSVFGSQSGSQNKLYYALMELVTAS
jgi:hypothetical protein